MLYALLAVGSYLLGSVPFGYVIAKMRGVDITSVGSGNIGATNVTRALGWRLGALVFLLDIAKGAIPPIVAEAVLQDHDGALLIGVASVLGHTFSPFLRFKGGKGVATSLGVLVGNTPIVGGAAFAVFLAMFGATRIVSVSSLVAAPAVLVFGYLTAQSWVFFAVYSPLVVYIFFRHRANIERLMKGEEPKITFKKRRDGD